MVQEIHDVVYCISVLFSDGLEAQKLLLLKRAPSKKLYPNLYGFVAGHVEPSESLEQAALREIEEETGRKDTRLIPIVDVDFTILDKRFRGRVFLTIFPSKNITLSSEHMEFEWVDFSFVREIRSGYNVTPPTMEILTFSSDKIDSCIKDYKLLNAAAKTKTRNKV